MTRNISFKLGARKTVNYTVTERKPVRSGKGFSFKPGDIEDTGLYFVYPKGAKAPIYIGFSDGHLYAVYTRHFQSWKDKQYRAVFPDDCTIKFLFPSDRYARLNIKEVESYLIRKYAPAANVVRYRTTRRAIDPKTGAPEQKWTTIDRLRKQGLLLEQNKRKERTKHIGFQDWEEAPF